MLTFAPRLQATHKPFDLLPVTDLLQLVDTDDQPIGEMSKMEVHQRGLLHRAFSVFIFNSSGELLLQRRAFSKYHSGGLWTNTCCGHPAPGEITEQAAIKRLDEEMGFSTTLRPQFSLIYRADLDNQMTEHEFDHVLFGDWEGNPKPNPEEVADWRWESIDSIGKWVLAEPSAFTFWFRKIWEKMNQD